jgi:hypothetical protein
MPVRMDEPTWLACPDPLALLDHCFGGHSPDSTVTDTRRVQLYFLGCCRRGWGHLPWVGRALVEVAESLPDGQSVDPRLLSAAQAAAEELVNNPDPDDALAEAERYLEMGGPARPAGVPPATADHDPKTFSGLAHLVYYAFRAEAPIFGRVPAGLHCADLVREVFGNPFRDVWFDLRWRTTEVRALARGIYRTRDFSPMPILADALQDAGCENPGVLNHCRGTTPHVRGCWVLDGLLTAADRR